MSKDVEILIVDDEQSMREFLSIMLKKEGFAVSTASSGDEAIKVFESRRYGLVITDLKMPGDATGLDVLRHVRSVDPHCQVVVMTAFASPETAILAIKEGAYDYIMKPFKLDQVRVVMERALEKFQLVSENVYLKKALEQPGLDDIIGRSEPMKRVFDLILRVAATKTTILVTGESGTGKELVARAIHQNSAVKDGPFIAVNCGAIPETLIDAELFGYRKGAFTGANTDRKGVFEAARQGTIFLDEVGELPQATQVRLLRVVQERQVRPVGGNDEIEVDCRIVAATNRDLKEEVESGRFREDLFYRLNVIAIDLPPLRERKGDLKLLVEYMIRRYAREIGNPVEGIEADALRHLLAYDYPGNVRELQNVIERAVTLEPGTLITADSLPEDIRKASHPAPVSAEFSFPPEGIDLDAMVEDLERRMMNAALERTAGNRTEAAKLLSISFRSMRYRLKKYGMEE